MIRNVETIEDAHQGYILTFMEQLYDLANSVLGHDPRLDPQDFSEAADAELRAIELHLNGLFSQLRKDAQAHQ